MNKQKHSPIWTFLALLVLALFLIFVVYPLVLILYKSVINPSDGSFTLENFTRFFTRKYYTNTLNQLLQSDHRGHAHQRHAGPSDGLHHPAVSDRGQQVAEHLHCGQLPVSALHRRCCR